MPVAIMSLAELEKQYIPSPHICIDLDATMIATVFTNFTPLECMKYYKVGLSENRYSILRPGIKELLCLLKIRNLTISVITDAKMKRVSTILEQFQLLDYIDFIIARECLMEVEEILQLERRRKPLSVFRADILFDDYVDAKIENGEHCILIKPFQARYEEEGVLLVFGSDQKWHPYDKCFYNEEEKYVKGWIGGLAYE